MVKVICAADDCYAMPLGVALSSLVINCKIAPQLDIFIIDGGITPRNRQKIDRSLQTLAADKLSLTLHWIDPKQTKVAQKIASLPNLQYFSRNTYFRLFIDQLLSDQIEKIIYLDSDIIVEEDISELWQIDIGENHLLAVQDMGKSLITTHSDLAGYQDFNISPTAKYFNAGLLSIDLNKYRKFQIGDRCWEYLNQYREQIKFADQDALNAVLAGKWGELDPCWNRTPWLLHYSCWQESPFSEPDYHNLMKSPYIIHFATPSKPWHFKVNYREDEKRFYHYLDRTQWKGWRAKEPWQTKLARYGKKLRSLVERNN
jgi:lipopolysaccharide biosynthesis glycosyltransferase